MTFNDILKSSFLEKIGEFSFVDSFIALLGAYVLGMFIYWVYKRTFNGVMYSKPFNTSLVLLTMLTTFIILAVTTNVVLSLGMVGALSIVRFRTAIKDPLDLVFLFWSLGTGIILGAGLLPLAILGCVMIGGVLTSFQAKVVKEAPYILMMDVDSENTEITASEIIRKRISRMKLKSKTVGNGRIELIYELRLKNGETGIANELANITGVKNTSLVSYNGEYAV
ncbi:DUF4956 domain-containing protein [Alkalibacter mobilis]|uniref:DUF4956 domain-containing protein n=1 Tax=Alkalibacter mobilis TaxID=2787712 RepID=UPI00189F019F|nr:DUF4956 domain-containing protein [Alkalibacter mobilis]MBF7096627.1 DUF4956 domain-containing protein [Alkalibacter mobilis]